MKELTPEQCKTLLQTLKLRFEKIKDVPKLSHGQQ